MPISVEDTADELNARLQKKGGEVLTMPWAEFYKLCNADRFKEQRLDKIWKYASDQYGLIFSYGRNVILVAHDRNFASK